MPQLSRLLTLLVLLAAAGSLVAGCTGFSGSNNDDNRTVDTGTLNVTLDYVTMRVSAAGEELGFKLPDAATSFKVEIVDQNYGVALMTQTVTRTVGVDNQLVTFSLVPVGNYNLKVTAFDANGAILGIFIQAVAVQQGTNTVNVATVSPTASP